MMGLRVFAMLALVGIVAGFVSFGVKSSNNRFLLASSKNYGPGAKAAKSTGGKGFGTKPASAPTPAKEPVKTTAFSVVDVLTPPQNERAPAAAAPAPVAPAPAVAVAAPPAVVSTPASPVVPPVVAQTPKEPPAVVQESSRFLGWTPHHTITSPSASK
jgi:hypothetical protein